MFDLAYAEDVHLVHKNLHFRDGNGFDDYYKEFDGILTIEITAIGSESNKIIMMKILNLMKEKENLIIKNLARVFFFGIIVY